MIKKIHIGLGVLLLAVPLLIAACSDDDNNVVTAGAGAVPSAATWLCRQHLRGQCPSCGAIDNLYYNVTRQRTPAGDPGQLDASGAVRLATNRPGSPQVLTPLAPVLVVDNVTNQVRFIRTSGLAGTRRRMSITPYAACRGRSC
jgi:hypothetical protein